MMIAPESYGKELTGMTYFELMRERERLLCFMHQFEAEETAGDRSNSAWRVRPSPEVRYQVYLDYLAVLCRTMHEKYNREYARGGRTLKQDAEEKTVRGGRDL